MKKAYTKDIWRSINKGKKRFFSIMLITALGVTMLSGLKAACVDLRHSADAFYNGQGLFDISIVSTLGLTDEDVGALEGMDGIRAAEGFYSETVYTLNGEKRQSAEVKTLSRKGINVPYVLEGELPQKADEIAVTEKYLKETGKNIGDTLVIEESDLNASGTEDSCLQDSEANASSTEDSGLQNSETDNSELDSDFSIDSEDEEEPNFRNTTYRITAVVIDPMDINSAEGAISFRSSSTTDYTFFVLPEAVDSEVYTAVYLTLADSEDLLSYSEEYEAAVKQVVQAIETQIKGQRERVRYEEVAGEAYEKLADAEQEINDKFREADEEFADAEKELEDGRQELEDGQKELEDQERKAKSEFSRARQEIEDGFKALEEGEAQLADSEKQLADGEKQLEEASWMIRQKEEEAYAQLTAARSQLEASVNQAQSGRAQLSDQADQLLQLSDMGVSSGDTGLGKAWNAYVSEAGDAFRTVAALQMQVSLLEQQIAAAQRTEAEQQIAAAQRTEAEQQIAAAQQTEAEQQIGAAQRTEETKQEASEYEAMISQLDQLQQQLQEARAAALAALEPAQNAFLGALMPAVEAAGRLVDGQIASLDPSAQDYTERLTALQTWKYQLETSAESLPAMAASMGQLDATLDLLTEQLAMLDRQQAEAAAQFDSARKSIADNEAELAKGKEQLEEGRKELESSRAKLEDGKAELERQEKDARIQIADGKQELEEGREELTDGEQELLENKQEFQVKKGEAEEKLEDARREIEDIDMAQWYVQDRSSLSGYENIRSDASSIEAVGTAFPIVFFIVAILISLTTITRMVEEDRGLIGTYKALGFTNAEVRCKYLLYAVAACTAGGILGDIFGFILLPVIVFVIFRVMYLLPSYMLLFDPLYGIGGVLLFVAGIAGAALIACQAELKQTPAVLMRPKSPSSGSRVFLEYIASLWKRLSFLNKVTARNLFRYKKRLIMTVAGIMGCTALVLCGFAIKDSVTDLMPGQYEHIYEYDLMVVFSEDDNDEIVDFLEKEEDVADCINVRIDSVKVKNAQGKEEKVQLVVVPDGASLDGYICLENLDGQPVQLDDSGIAITQNASRVLDFGEGSTVSLQDLELVQKDVRVVSLVKNYLGNTVYMTQNVYEELFGTYEPNGVLANLSESCDDQPAYADMLGRMDGVLSSSSTEAMKQEFTTAFALINMVVYIIIIMAAGLALVVLFTLSTTNISERERELATIKVLGFFDAEVHLYVNKETLILTEIGILLGLPLGSALGGCLTYVLNMPSIHFAVSIHPVSYVLAAAISFGFALAVDLITNRVLDGIDPVEALKSIE